MPLPEPASSADGARPPVPPDPARPGPGRLSARLTALRECEGEHVQATLFRPVDDEALCHDCLRRSLQVA
ncbi:hypothetical protein [Streptomyces sp. NPDC058625]|uniref:hypothetical protein n=1 Tax=Streptomyces sp. NPDC058625 TaxID=3346564 RepID=UPI003668C3E6